MRISGDNNRFLVCSYGRAGSVALCERLNSHLILKNIDAPKWYGFGHDQYNLSNFDPMFNDDEQAIGHCHSIKQTKYSYKSAQVFFAYRRPHEVAISMLLADKLKYQHIYSPHYIEKIKQRENESTYYKEVLLYVDNFNKNEKVVLEIDALQWTRTDCIKWNNKILKIIKDRPFFKFNYNKWKNRMDEYCVSIGCNYDSDHFSVVKNPRRWEDSVVNVEEVSQWIAHNIGRDEREMGRWNDAILF